MTEFWQGFIAFPIAAGSVLFLLWITGFASFFFKIDKD